MNIPIHLLPWRAKSALSEANAKISEQAKRLLELERHIDRSEDSFASRVAALESSFRSQLAEAQSMVDHLRASDLAHHATEDLLRNQIAKLQADVGAAISGSAEPELRSKIESLEKIISSKDASEHGLRSQVEELGQLADKLLQENQEYIRLAKNHQKSSERNRKGIAALISWIEAAHRLSPAKPGTIHDALQQMQREQVT